MPRIFFKIHQPENKSGREREGEVAVTSCGE